MLKWSIVCYVYFTIIKKKWETSWGRSLYSLETGLLLFSFSLRFSPSLLTLFYWICRTLIRIPKSKLYRNVHSGKCHSFLYPFNHPFISIPVGNQFYYFLCYQSCIIFCQVIQICACFLIFSSFLQKNTSILHIFFCNFYLKYVLEITLSVYKDFSFFFFYQFPVLQSVYLS